MKRWKKDPLPTNTHFAKKALCLTLSSALVLASCASTGTGQTRSSFQTTRTSAQPLVFDDTGLSPGDALVVIRYPAFIDDKAKSPFYESYTKRPIGGQLRNSAIFVEGADQLASAFLLKNHYFAVSIYKALQARLPEDTVFLSPHIIHYELGEGLYSEPVLSSEDVPHALTVDFSSYSFPDTDRLLKATAVTFGDLVTPMSTIRTDHHALPATNGLIAASSPFASTAWRDAAAQAQPISLGNTSSENDSHILIDFLEGGAQQASPTTLRYAQAMGAKVSLGKVDILPVEKIQMDSEAVKLFSGVNQGTINDPFRSAYASDYANRLIAYLNALDLPKATAAAKQDAISAFDYDAAHLYFAAADDNAVDTRINFAERLLKAERRYLASQSEAIVNSLGPTEFGNQLGELFAAEQENLEQRRELARQQSGRTMLAILGAITVAGAAYGAVKAGNSGKSGTQSAYRALGTVALGLAAYSGLSARSKSNQQRMLGRNFLATIAPSLQASEDVTVELIEGSEQITAANYPELRQKMLNLYAQRMRSMDVSALPCTFASPLTNVIGMWYGPCEDGAATGNGYGVIAANGPSLKAIEYFGEAAAGVASGAGYLILAGGTANPTTSYEGSFLAGVPHGVSIMTTTGKSPKSGLYENGERVGRAPSNVAIPQVLSSLSPRQVYVQ